MTARLGARWIATLRAIFLPLVLAGCVPGGLTDFSSVSVGTFNAGALRHGRRLAARGEGYIVPPLWAARDASWGTDELVGLIERVPDQIGVGRIPGAEQRRLPESSRGRHQCQPSLKTPVQEIDQTCSGDMIGRQPRPREFDTNSGAHRRWDAINRPTHLTVPASDRHVR